MGSANVRKLDSELRLTQSQRAEIVAFAMTLPVEVVDTAIAPEASSAAVIDDGQVTALVDPELTGSDRKHAIAWARAAGAATVMGLVLSRGDAELIAIELLAPMSGVRRAVGNDES